MPSDARTRRALESLAPRRDRFRSVVSSAHDQMASYLAAHRARTQGHAHTAARELGRFASGRIDSERFGTCFAEAQVLSMETTERVERLVGVLAELLAEGDDLFIADVPPGGDLRRVVDDAIAQLGRVFGVVLAYQAVKAGTYRPDRHERDMAAFPFARWNRSERSLAIPLVVEVDGPDLCAGSLAEYVDGGVAIVLVVRGPSTAVPLVRLITPGTFVVQGVEVGELRGLAAAEGPAIGALLSPGAARFVHDPGGGSTMGSRLVIAAMPDAAPVKPLGSHSVWQQQQELAMLRELRQSGQLMAAAAPPLPVGAAVFPDAGGTTGVGGTGAGAVDRLTTWLLTEVGLATSAPAGGVG